MSIFSRLFKNLKRGLSKVAPLVAPALGIALPGIGGVIGGALLGGLSRPLAVPLDIGRPPLPGGGFVQTAAARRGDVGRRRVITTPTRPFQQAQTMSIFSQLPGILTTARTALAPLGRALTSRTAGAVGAGALGAQILGGIGDGGACPSGFHLAKDGSGRCVRNRRMNFGNARAARRSVRRLKGARKLLKDIESMMPRRPAGRRSTVRHVTGPAHTT